MLLSVGSFGELAAQTALPDSLPTAFTAARPRRLPAELSQPLRPRPADAERLAELRSQRAFTYIEKPLPSSSTDTLWTRFWQWLARQLAKTSYRYFWRWVLYALLVGAAVFVVLRLLEVDLTGLLSRSARRAPLAYDTAEENIHEVDFSTRLGEAETAGNFRLAVRLGYLQLLKQLSDNGLIQWQPNKTNHAYLNELAPATSLRTDFREIVWQFEYIWYGELALDAALYARVREMQQVFTRQLARPHASQYPTQK